MTVTLYRVLVTRFKEPQNAEVVLAQLRNLELIGDHLVLQEAREDHVGENYLFTSAVEVHVDVRHGHVVRPEVQECHLTPPR